MSPKQNFLIVDDSQGDRLLIEEALTNMGSDIKIHATEDGKEVFKIVDQLKPDLIVILDTLMPGMDGYEICKKIKAMDERVKVIICTGIVDAVDAAKARASGADDYCVKTVDYEPLIMAIKNILIN